MKDPLAGLIVLLDLESIGLRGEAIWRLYRDVYCMKLESRSLQSGSKRRSPWGELALSVHQSPGERPIPVDPVESGDKQENRHPPLLAKAQNAFFTQ